MIKIVHDSENNKAVAYDENKSIGESTYSKSEKLWIIDHTFVDENYGGQGIGGKLVAELVKEARKNKVKIIPLCPFAKKEFLERPEYSDVLSK